MNIYNALEQIRATASKKEKEAILKANDSPELREYLYSVYNPQYNYYMKKIPEPVVNGRDLLPYFSVSRELLEQLRTRALTGHAAISAVASALGRLEPEERELLRYALLGDVQAGFGISTINKAFGKAFIFEPPYQRCETEANANFDKWDWNLNVKHLCQMKADGMFVNIIKKHDGITFMTRGGNTFPTGVLSDLAWHVNDSLPLDHVTHGELVVYKDGKALPRTTSNGMLNSALQGEPLDTGYIVKALVWDCVEIDAWERGETNLCYAVRLARLKRNLHIGLHVELIETHEVSSVEEAKALALEWMKLGHEGAIVKNAAGVWKDHTSPNQVKIKACLEVELRIVGMLDGKATGKNADTFGSLDMVSEDENLRVAVTGFSDELRQYIFDNWHEEFYGQVCTVKANQLLMPSKSNKDYSLFLPNYVEIRHDRKEADDIERIISIFKPFQPDLK